MPLTTIKTKVIKAKILKLANGFGQFMVCPKTYKEEQTIEMTECYNTLNQKTWWEHNLVRSINYPGWASIDTPGPTVIADRAILDEYFKIIK